jgi:hypothetical protein
MSIGGIEVVLLLLIIGVFLLGPVLAGGYLAYRLSRRSVDIPSETGPSA